MTRLSKPSKPKEDFPLFPHRNRQWAKKIRGKLHYFGSWANGWEAALENYERDKDALFAGRDPRRPAELTVADGCNLFLTAKELLLNNGELGQISYNDYERTCKHIIEKFGRLRTISSLTPTDFNELRELLGKTRGPVALGNEINRVRIVFRYLDTADLIERPVKFGPHFRRPSAKLIRLAKAQSGSKYVTAEEVTALLSKANTRLKAMIYLAINTALGNSDIGHLKHEHIDYRGRWLNSPRPKTGVNRRAKLWPETIKALLDVPLRRPLKPEYSSLVFLTQTGNPWKLDKSDNPVSQEMRKLVIACKVRRKGLGFYSLRHTFNTVAEGCGDLPAVRSIMGHAPSVSDMPSVYRHGITDERLEKVANYVRKWLKSAKKVSKRVS